MADFIENAKRMASSAVERATWEADKLRRAAARQRDIELLHRERAALLEQIVAAVMDLERRGQLPAGPLGALAQRLRTLDAEVGNREAEVQQIRAEAFTPGSINISVQRKDAADEMPCPTCGRPVRRSSAYCSACGARLR